MSLAKKDLPSIGEAVAELRAIIGKKGAPTPDKHATRVWDAAQWVLVVLHSPEIPRSEKPDFNCLHNIPDIVNAHDGVFVKYLAKPDFDSAAISQKAKAKLEKLWGTLTDPYFPRKAAEGKKSQQVLRFLDEVLRTLKRAGGVTRPEFPTSKYCLLRGFRVRWLGEPIKLQPLLYSVLECFLTRRSYPFPQSQLEADAWEDETPKAKTVANTVSRLNNALEAVHFPWQWHIKKAHVHRVG